MNTKNIDMKQSLLFTALIITSIIKTLYSRFSSTSGEFTVAYLDPGTGTMIISAIVGILATAALGVKTFWYKIGSVFKPGNKKNPANTTKKSK